MPPQGTAYNVDWIISNTSNVHVANDRAWFTTHTPFRTKIATSPGAVEPSVEVHGIGTVVLPTRTYLEGKAHKPSGEITLHTVLYAPTVPVNILATIPLELTQNFNFQFNGRVATPITKGNSNKVLGLVVRSTLFRLWLKGQSHNQSSLKPNGFYYFHASWPSSEVARFNKHVTDVNHKRAGGVSQVPPLTDEERQFMKKHYGNEFQFLMTQGLHMHKEEDREDGRRILRAFMAESEDEVEDFNDNQDLDHNQDFKDDQDSVKSDDLLAELEQDPTSHVAEYKFSSEQLDYIKTRYGHSGNFMRNCNLQPWVDSDCDQAVRLVETFMYGLCHLSAFLARAEARAGKRPMARGEEPQDRETKRRKPNGSW